MDWRTQHGEIIKSFLDYLNKESSDGILKGGTALAQCYGLNRFSEDIDLDGKGKQIINICQQFSKIKGYECRIAKDTDTVKRCMIHYGGIKPLKIELSTRRKNIPESEITVINGIKTYTIDTMALLKVSAYQQRDKIRDLFDVAFIINNYYEELSSITKTLLQTALQYKGLEHFDYIISNQKDDLIDANTLAEAFLQAYEKVGLLLDNNTLLLNNASYQMEQIYEQYAIEFRNGNKTPILWKNENYTLSEFEDLYIAQCKLEGKTPLKKISEHFWENCVASNGYEPKYCSRADKTV